MNDGTPPRWSRYVALGDSFTEGVGDDDPSRPHGVRGWADRVAEVLGAARGAQGLDFDYANLAIRGRKLGAVLDEQVGPALELRPDLVSVYAGGNDLMRPTVDIDTLVAAYAEGLRPVVDSGAQLVLFTGFDLGWAPLFGRLRGRVATYNELVREVADDLGATLVDFWRLRDHRDPRMWAVDRIHMSALGHRRMAVAVLDALGVRHDLAWSPLPEMPPVERAARREADRAWARAHAAPWIQRRVTGRSSGDGLTPRFPVPVRDPGAAEAPEVGLPTAGTTGAASPERSGIV
ncbi:SGNH/GDSL hydrolase family protein [Nocardioides sp. HDW12B]|uniref:SGNH/GDSL hydrolase family protein n=1 Tax=Nocardioides sp. HDW12B TaxID=2714939 RepID=UPI001F11769D|nr:SGNH/GDSL hydrolase family protein [Nocardioides sp. HDW12B]